MWHATRDMTHKLTAFYIGGNVITHDFTHPSTHGLNGPNPNNESSMSHTISFSKNSHAESTGEWHS